MNKPWESLGLQGYPTSPFWRRLALVFLWKEWCWSWNSSTLATTCEELTHWKRLWCWEGLGAGGEGANRGWDRWMASLTRWAWVWVNSGSLWWTGRPGVLRFMGSQRVGHDWVTDLIWSLWVFFGPNNNVFHLDSFDINIATPPFLWLVIPNMPQFTLILVISQTLALGISIYNRGYPEILRSIIIHLSNFSSLVFSFFYSFLWPWWFHLVQAQKYI